MDAKKELKILETEINEFLLPRKKRERELNNIIEQELIEEQKAIYKAIDGKSYYGDKTTWSGYKNVIHLVKPVGCSNWSDCNSCSIIQIRIELEKDKFKSFHFDETTCRVDQFKTHYIPMTEAHFEKVKNILNSEVLKPFNHFV